MEFTAIIAEFNPFTLGHEYLINEAKKMFPNSKILIIMSGNFVQRGEASIVDKFTRANHAINGGADLVIELPTAYALSSGQDFAYGAINILNKIPGVKNLIFGSECGDIENLKNAKYALLNETESSKNAIKESLNNGISFATSVIKNYPILSSPNNLLATMYLLALEKTNSKIKPVTIKRINNYNSLSLNEMPSASAIRNLINNGNKIDGLIPSYTLTNFNDLKPINQDCLYAMLSYKLLTLSNAELSIINGITEGFENKIQKENIIATNYNELVENLTSKRHFKNKVKRILLNTLFNITKEDIKNLNDNPYINLLAINKEDKNGILKELIKSNCPVINKAKDINCCPDNIKKLMSIDLLASNTYSILTSITKNLDYTKKI